MYFRITCFFKSFLFKAGGASLPAEEFVEFHVGHGGGQRSHPHGEKAPLKRRWNASKEKLLTVFFFKDWKMTHSLVRLLLEGGGDFDLGLVWSEASDTWLCEDRGERPCRTTHSPSSSSSSCCASHPAESTEEGRKGEPKQTPQRPSALRRVYLHDPDRPPQRTEPPRPPPARGEPSGPQSSLPRRTPSPEMQ